MRVIFRSLALFKRAFIKSSEDFAYFLTPEEST